MIFKQNCDWFAFWIDRSKSYFCGHISKVVHPSRSVDKHFSVHVNLVENLSLLAGTAAVVIWLSSIWKYNYISRSNFFNRSPQKNWWKGRKKRGRRREMKWQFSFCFEIHREFKSITCLQFLSPLFYNTVDQKIALNKKHQPFQNQKCFLKSWTPYCFIKKTPLHRMFTILIFLKNLDMIAISGWQFFLE